MNSIADGFCLLASAIWSAVQYWSMLICIAGLLCLLYSAWTHRPLKTVTSTIALTAGIAGAFL